MKLSVIYLLFLSNLALSQMGGGYYSDTNISGIIELHIHKNHTFICKHPTSLHLVANKDSLFYNYSGVWFKCGNQLILNSYNQPDFDTILNVVETVCNNIEKNGMMKFVFYPRNGYIKFSKNDSIMDRGPNYILINNAEFIVPRNGILEIDRMNIKTFSILNTRYNSEEYVVHNPRANLFEIYIKIDGSKLHYPQGSYFKNEIFTIKADSILINNSRGRLIKGYR